jgi:hypothetical protein
LASPDITGVSTTVDAVDAVPEPELNLLSR